MIDVSGVMHQIQRLSTETCEADSPKKESVNAAAGPSVQPGTSSGEMDHTAGSDHVDFLGAVAAQEPTSPTPQM